MKIVVRTDASFKIGSGHVMRCLVLADKLKNNGFCVKFACLPLTGNMIDFIKSSGFPVIKLTFSGSVSDSYSGHLSWLQQSDEEDAGSFLLQVEEVDWVILDHYALDYKWEKLVADKLSCQILAIDDLNRRHYSDIILDQNLWPNIEQRYLSSCAMKLFGPKYALLRKEFSSLRELKISPASNQLLVFFGGTDPTNECEKFILAGNDLNDLPFFTILIAGRINPTFNKLVKLNTNTHIQIYKNLENYDHVLANSHYIIGASGVSNWERFCLHVPASIVSVAENQIVLSNYLSSLGFVRYLGRGEETTVATYREELKRLSRNWNTIKPFNALDVDGLGADRVVKAMEERAL